MKYTAASLLLCNIHRNTFSVLLPQISASLALSPSQAGAIQAATLFTYLLGQLPAGRLADQLSGTRVMVVGLFLWSAATALTGIPCIAASSSATATAAAAAASWVLPLLLLSRGLMGLASAAAMPCVTATSAQLVPPAERASAVASAYSAFNIGGVLGLAAIPPLALAVGLPGAFFITGLAGMAWAVWGALTLPPTHTKAAAAAQGSSKEHKRSQPTAAAAGTGQQQQKAGGISRLLQLPRSTLVQLGVLCYSHAVMGYCFFILQNWIPTFLASFGGSGQGIAVTGGLSSIPWIAAAVVGPLVGRAANSLIKGGHMGQLAVRRLMQVVCFLGCAVSVVPLALVKEPSVTLAVACLTGSLALYSFSASGFHSYLQDVSKGNAGVVFGITNSVSIAAGIFGNLLTGLVLEASGSYSSVFVLFAALNVSAAALFATATSEAPVVL